MGILNAETAYRAKNWAVSPRILRSNQRGAMDSMAMPEKTHDFQILRKIDMRLSEIL